ncbi:MAG: serine hydrolase [Bacteroidetes bacterium]|nr:serine hydrolase [Bacteroidota bacterium]
MKKRIFFSAGLVVLAGLIWGVVYLNSLLPIITGYPAKYLCSAVFISNRNPDDVEASELNFSFIRFVTNDINYQDKSVTSRFLWGRSKAIYRDGFGSTLLRDVDETSLTETKFPFTPAGYNQDTIAWPLGNIISDTNRGADITALGKITDNLFVNKYYKGNPFAFMVVHHGIPVAERYKPGFSAKTRFISWSIAKSFINALAGIMVHEEMLNIYRKTDIPEWKNDARQQITVHDLMQMQSGLNWNEEYGNRSDVTLMLYNEKDFAGYAFTKPLDYPSGSHWYYSSGATNIVSYLMRKQFRNDSAYLSYTSARLFNKTGMPDAIFETDPTGTQVGSSYIYATARDYARFGMLYLNDGMFNGVRLLPEGWVAYTTTPAEDSHGNYGSFFWLNKGKHYPAAPADMFICNGHDGQRIFIIPSRDLVVVVLGYSPKPDNEMNFNLLLKDILEALK